MSGAEAWEDPEEVALRPKHSFYEVTCLNPEHP